MPNNSQRNQARASHRGANLIPPLPQTKLVPEKDSEARSPLGRPQKDNGSAFPFRNNQEHSRKSKFGRYRSDQNKDQDMNRGILAPLPFSHNGKRQSQRNIANVTVDKEIGLPILPSSSRTLVSTKTSNSKSVLRPIETMESLFGLTSESSDEYRELSAKIADGRLSDAAAWNKVLELARQQEESNRLSSSSNKQSTFLHRLHRRAIQRFPISKLTKDPTIVLKIWLAYAGVLEKAGNNNIKDVRVAFRQIKASGSAKEASFYLAYAAFEQRNKNIRDAKDILKSGMEKQAQPVQLLEEAFKGLAQTCAPGLEPMPQNPTAVPRSKTAVSRKLDRTTQERAPPALSPRKRKAEPSVSPKRRRTETGAVVVMPEQSQEDEGNVAVASQKKLSVGAVADSLTPQAEARSNGTLDYLSLSNDNVSKPRLTSSVSSLPRSTRERKPLQFASTISALQCVNAIQSNDEATPSRNSAAMNQLEPQNSNSNQEGRETGKAIPGLPSATKAISRLGAMCRDGGSNLKRPPLSSKTPRLARVGLSGTAQRVETGNSTAAESGSDDDSITKAQNEEETVTNTVTQQDVSYIIEWKPGRHGNKDTGTIGDSKISTDEKAGEKDSKISKNDEKAGDKSLTSIAGNKRGSRPSLPNTQKTAECTTTLQSDSSDSSSSTNSSHSHASRRRSSESSTSLTKAEKLVATSNPVFLPLVNEGNIIKVNYVPYVKLGVVGKGGSSKVYRTLSKEYSVLAIKKVKISGMDQKAIDGYANEIALLKRLQNNPAIIQMHDSEVDLARKAIYVVMEAGEADLNHALKQRTTESKTLDMNFIRLTWQQMLNAVHSIHEERIIHGDLKPANFLFVRGTLKLIDFGIAKAIQSEDTTNIYRDSQVGTLNYMSPESILDSDKGKPGAPKMKCGRASDIWSLGCILYQMVYGRTPFADLHMIQKLRAIIDPDYKISFPETVNAAAIDAMKQCMRRNPQDRPPIVGKNGLLNEHIFLNEPRSHPS